MPFRPAHAAAPRSRRAPRLLAMIVALPLALGATACVPTGTRGEPEQSTDILFKGREDRNDADIDRRFGDPVTIDDLDAVIEKAEFVQEIGPNDKAGYIVATVSVKNTLARKVKVTRFHFEIITPDGETRTHTLVEGGREGELPVETELEKDQVASGTIAFNIGDEKGTFYVVYAPKEDNETRGVWGPVEVS